MYLTKPSTYSVAVIMEANLVTKNTRKLCAYIVLLLIICSTEPAWAQVPIRKGPESAQEIKKARAALDSNMNNQTAHKTYIYAMGLSNPLVVEQYREFIKKYPENVNIPLAIGTVYYNAEMPQAKEFLLKAAAIEPKNGEIWSMLADDANRRGQDDLSTEYLRKAALADTSDANYAYYYLSSFENSDPDHYSQKVFDFVKRFPTNRRGAQALYWLGLHAKNLNDQITYLEQLRKLYPPQQFDWSSAGMIRLTDAYLQTDPEKALVVINEMGDKKDWKTRKQVAESLIQFNQLVQDQKYEEAMIKLDNIQLPKVDHLDNFIAFKKISLQEKVGNAKAAYDTLSVKFAKLPTDLLYAALEQCGGKIGKDKKQIIADIETIRNSTAIPAYPFELGLYTGNGKLSLESLKGKVVLLTFWFPACGPCRDEFPHFQEVINTFKSENVAYVGINVFPEQDPYVIPFMKNTRYSFIPLRGNAEFAAKYYNVTSEPENFLIDQNGKIIFKNFRINDTNHRTLELMISSLLQKSALRN